ncbi:MAG: hypothetical protein QOJ07_3959, partial [Thermoleophilaceae bacterium]|nr:hypothetical protein [Thermoleophilaceae bacterium]
MLRRPTLIALAGLAIAAAPAHAATCP